MGESRSSVGKVPSSGVENADLVALCKLTQDLKAVNDDLLSHAAGEGRFR